MSNREAFRTGINLLLRLQRKLGHKPRKHGRKWQRIPKMVDNIIKEAEFGDHPNVRYFKLLATCALMGKEPMYNQFKPLRKRGE